MDNDIATGSEAPAQNVTSRIEDALFGAEEPETNDDEVASEEPEELPEDADTDSDEEEGSANDLDDVQDQAEMTLADYLGVPEDRIMVGEDGSVTLNAIIDGEAKQVNLPDLVKSYQLEGHVNNKSMSLEKEKREFQEQQAQVTEQLQQRLTGLENLGKVLERQLLTDYNAIDWDRLRVDNPSEWTALRQEYAEKAQKLQQAQQLMHEEGKRASEEQQKKMQAQQAQQLQEEMNKVIADNPTWSDENVMKAEQTKLRDFLSTQYGFNDEDMQYVTDHRLFRLIQDAQAYRSGKQTAEQKKTKPVPKFAKPGGGKDRSSQTQKARAVKAKRTALRKSGKIGDAASVLLDRM